MEALRRLQDMPERLVAGLMSGTSADGVDAALARISGSGRGIRVEPIAFVQRPYDDILRDLLLRNAEAASSTVREIALLDALLARLFASAVHEACEEAGIDISELDLIGSHGHTLHHIPEPQAVAGQWVAATLQAGDPATLAALTGVPTIGHFRSADVALGGQGAPLIPYFDWATLAHDTETRAFLNLGGIANVTVAPAGGRREDVFAFDTGPANMVIDALARRFLGASCDRDGAAAARGTAHEALLDALLADPYFAQPPPKSTGRERFGADYVEMLVASQTSPDDLLATATALTVRSVALGLELFAAPSHQIDALIVSGGGVHNPTLMRWLAEAVAPVPVRRSDAYGVDPNAKEALCFAVLAHEFINGVPTSLPGVTGASRPARLGVLALP